MGPAGLKTKIQKTKKVRGRLWRHFISALKNYEDQKVNLRFIYLHIKTEKRQKIIEPGQPGIIQKRGFFGSAILSPAGTPAELVKDSGTLWNAVEAGEAKGCRIMPLSGHSHPQGAGRRPEEADRPRLLPRKFRGLWNDCRHSIS